MQRLSPAIALIWNDRWQVKGLGVAYFLFKAAGRIV